MAQSTQPAKKGYFFGQGYKDMLEAIKNLWKMNAITAQEYSDKYQDKGLMSIKGVVWFICALSVVIFGTAFFIAISAVFVVLLFVLFAIVYIFLALVWLLDRTYLLRNKIFVACIDCKEKSLIPIYICGKCGAKHDNLTPGVYGVLKRRCLCGNKLPTSSLNGRGNLKAICPGCTREVFDRESVPICIPVVGGRSVGKTAFITAFSKIFIDDVAPSKRWTTSFYNPQKAQIFNEIKADFDKGSTRMTERTQDINQTTSVSFSFFVKSDYFKPDRLVHVYDIAGEVFTDGDENEIQKQYEYCQGIVFLIDPFSIPTVRHRYDWGLTPADRAGIGMADINGIIDTFLNKLRVVTGLSDSEMMKVPLAVIIGKTDSSNLAAEFSAKKVEAVVGGPPQNKMVYLDAIDALCRNFLQEHGMESFLQLIDMKFSANRFFKCSAIGHTRDEGVYKPQGVMEPMEWLFQQADPVMRRYWNNTEFSRTPMFR